MSKRFKCKHCRELHPVNIRLKVKQLYCGKRECQQARKNKWEREKLSNDNAYREKRKLQKSKWRKAHCSDQYQKRYRELHPNYVEVNRQKQKTRNNNRPGPSDISSGSKIVKTDASNRESLILSGLYKLLPYHLETSKKIVKTDALIVELRTYKGIQEELLIDSG